MELVKLTEQVRVKIIKELPLTESTQLIEGSDGKKYKSRGAYEVEISRYNHENLNGRIYTKKLWENVISKQKNIWDGSVGLLDHPKDEAHQKDVFCVYHNMRIKESNQTVVCDLYLVGQNGQDVKERLDAGGYIELSSSGLGEISSFDGKTVVEETYQIERPGDLVFDASQQVRFDNTQEIQQESIEEKKEESKTETDSEEKGLLENKFKLEEEKKMDKLTETNFKFFMKKSITEAKNLTNIGGKIDELKSLLEMCDGHGEYANDYKITITQELDESQKAYDDLAKKGEETDTLKEEKNKLEESRLELQNKLDETTKLLDEAKESTLKMTELYEREKAKNNTLVSAEEFKEQLDKIKDLEEKLSNTEEVSTKVEESKEDKPLVLKGKIIVEEKDDSKVDSKSKKIKEAISKEIHKKFKESKIKPKSNDSKYTNVYKGKDKYLENAKKFSGPTQEDAVKALYETWVEQEPEIEVIKKEILECRTEQEAVATRIKLKSVYKSFTENKKNSKPSDLKGSVKTDDEVFSFQPVQENVVDSYLKNSTFL